MVFIFSENELVLKSKKILFKFFNKNLTFLFPFGLPYFNEYRIFSLLFLKKEYKSVQMIKCFVISCLAKSILLNVQETEFLNMLY